MTRRPWQRAAVSLVVGVVAVLILVVAFTEA